MAIIGAGGRTPNTPTHPTAAGDDVVKDGTITTFAQDVMQASQQVPVLVDFWAPWCGPCKQLTPTLEKVVRAAQGQVKLVKINIDENAELAQQLRIQSVPTVYAFWQGQPVTGFAGAQPESQVKQLVDKLIETAGGGVGGGEEGPSALEQARALLEEGDFRTAAEVYSTLLQDEPEKPELIGGFARALLGLNRVEDARKVLDQAPANVSQHAEITGAQAAVDLAESAGKVRDPQIVEEDLRRDPDDHAARLELANGLFLRGQPENAIEQLLTIVKRDRSWNDDAARKRLLTFFEALGPTHPLTVQGRRKLSSLLFS
ncbi:MAG: thioredoxin [Alphaproteobacteria bacterium]|jgi:putative thioredoxin|nr:thioredoxin [Alphaproteobacteria bacterium]